MHSILNGIFTQQCGLHRIMQYRILYTRCWAKSTLNLVRNREKKITSREKNVSFRSLLKFGKYVSPKKKTLRFCVTALRNAVQLHAPINW